MKLSCLRGLLFCQDMGGMDPLALAHRLQQVNCYLSCIIKQHLDFRCIIWCQCQCHGLLLMRIMSGMWSIIALFWFRNLRRGNKLLTFSKMDLLWLCSCFSTLLEKCKQPPSAVLSAKCCLLMSALQLVNIFGDDDGSAEMEPRSEQNRHTTSVNVYGRKKPANS